MQINPADISPHKVWGPLLLLMLPVINGFVSLVSLPAAISVVLPALSESTRNLFGVVGFFVMFTIELFIVTWSPSPPRWIGAISAPPQDRLVAKWRTLFSWFAPLSRSSGPAGYMQDSSGHYVPPMPSFPERLVTFLPRLALTLVVAVFVGGGANLALNASSINYEKGIIHTAESQVAADAAYNQHVETLKASINDTGIQRGLDQTALNTWQDRLNCNNGTVPRSQCSIDPGPGPDTDLSKEQVGIFKDKVAKDDAALGTLNASLHALLTAGSPSSQKDFQPPPDSLSEGINTTLAAFAAYVEKNHIGFIEAHIMEILLAVVDLVPVTFKLLTGFPVYEHHAWNRGIREILNRRHQLRSSMRLDAMGYEYLDSPQAKNILNAAAVKVVQAMARRWIFEEESLAPLAGAATASGRPLVARV